MNCPMIESDSLVLGLGTNKEVEQLENRETEKEIASVVNLMRGQRILCVFAYYELRRNIVC